MNTTIANAEFLTWPATIQLLHALKQADINARFVGGAVRDSLLGRDVTDVDLASPTPPEQAIQKLRAQGLRVVPTGIEHGTITIVIEGVSFELTTLRHDISCDGRHAIVAYTDDWAEDAKRRDFTINALYADADGKVYDYHHGLADLNARRIAFIGDSEARIKEDALRILRLFRFQAQLGFEVEQALYETCKKKLKLLKPISSERILEETFKLLSADSPCAAWHALFDYGVAHKLYGGLLAASIEVVLEAEKQLLRSKLPADQRLALLAWLAENHDADALQRLLTLSNAQTKTIERLYTHALHIRGDMSIKEQRKWHYLLGSELYRLCIVAVCASDLREHMERTQARFIRMIEDIGQWQPPTFPIGGDDLIKLGIAPGKPLGDILRKLESDWVESGFELRAQTLLARAQQDSLSA